MDVLALQSSQGRWLPTCLEGGDTVRPKVRLPTAEEPFHFVWDALAGEPSHFRLTTAEYRDEEFCFEIRDAQGEVVGQLDIRYCVTGQVFEAELATGVDASAGLSMAPAPGSATLGFYVEAPKEADASLCSPHLLVPGTSDRSPVDVARSNLANWPLSELGFMEGCLLEALLRDSQFGESGRQAARRRLEAYLPHLADNSVEGSLPAAALARLEPTHPELQAIRQRWENHRGPDGAIEEGQRIVAEGSYTVAYPMAVIAVELGDSALAEDAAQQLRLRRDRLRTPGIIWLRHFQEEQRSFPNWARGVAWYLLGLAYTLPLLEELALDLTDLKREVQEIVDLAIQWQRADGLWGAYLDREACPPDTSGSAGIAAALAKLGKWMAQPTWTDAAQQAEASLGQRMTEDGLIGGATQHNAGGEALQNGTYRVYQPYTLAFYFLLRAELD